MYAGQLKVEKDILKKLKRETSSAASNAKKAKLNTIYYYAKLINKNKNN